MQKSGFNKMAIDQASDFRGLTLFAPGKFANLLVILMWLPN